MGVFSDLTYDKLVNASRRLYQIRAGNSEEEQPLRLPGHEIAAHNSVGPDEHYNIFRWYQSGWGRYTQPDPLGPGGLGIMSVSLDSGPEYRKWSDFARFAIQLADEGSPFANLNLYAYAADDPVSGEDELGLWPVLRRRLLSWIWKQNHCARRSRRSESAVQGMPGALLLLRERIQTS